MNVSIIIPNYNHLIFLPQRLDSIFNQTFQDFEIILLDDFSTDDSWEFLKTIENHPKVSYCIRNDSNSGSPFRQWNKGFELAKYDWIWIAESDDYSDPDFLATMISMIGNTNSDIAYCQSWELSGNYSNPKRNTWLLDLHSTFWDDDYMENGFFLLEKFGRFKCPIVNVSSAIFKKELLKDLELPIGMKYSGDWNFWGQLFLRGKVAYSSQSLNYFRRHPESAINIAMSNMDVKLVEDTRTAKYINGLLGLNFEYSEEYLWLLIAWKKYIYKNRISGSFLAIKELPFSFIIQFLK